MQDKSRRFITGLFAVGVLFGFAALHGWAIITCWNTQGKGPLWTDPFVYVATLLAGLVGGVAAMVAGDQASPTPTKEYRPSVGTPNNAIKAPPPAGVLQKLQERVPSQQNSVLDWITFSYIIVYFFVVIGAISAWVRLGEDSPELIKNQALVGLGLMMASARSYFNIRPSGPEERDGKR